MSGVSKLVYLQILAKHGFYLAAEGGKGAAQHFIAAIRAQDDAGVEAERLSATVSQDENLTKRAYDADCPWLMVPAPQFDLTDKFFRLASKSPEAADEAAALVGDFVVNHTRSDLYPWMMRNNLIGRGQTQGDQAGAALDARSRSAHDLLVPHRQNEMTRADDPNLPYFHDSYVAALQRAIVMIDPMALPKKITFSHLRPPISVMS